MHVAQFPAATLLLALACGIAAGVVGCAPNSSAPADAQRNDSAAQTTRPVSAPTADAANRPAESEPSPSNSAAATLVDMTWDDVQSHVKQAAGRVVIVDVWSTACEPCIKEFPNLVELQAQLGDRIQCISLSCDYAGAKNKPPGYYRERVLKFLQEQHAAIINGLCTTPADELLESLQLDSIPAVYVYRKNGTLAKRFDSSDAVKDSNGEIHDFTYADQIAPLIVRLLAE